jgi:Predicted metal-dependent hydrolase with the TIM-barrel fold
LIALCIVNARVWTGNPRQPWATGIAVEGDRIIAVASSAEVAKLVVESTRVIDAKGKDVRNPGGTIERGGRADFVITETDSNPPDADSGKSEVILQVAAGEIILERNPQ